MPQIGRQRPCGIDVLAGNAIGVPNLGGDVYIDESFDDNVLVNVVALGLVKEHEIVVPWVVEQAVSAIDRALAVCFWEEQVRQSELQFGGDLPEVLKRS